MPWNYKDNSHETGLETKVQWQNMMKTAQVNKNNHFNSDRWICCGFPYVKSGCCMPHHIRLTYTVKRMRNYTVMKQCEMGNAHIFSLVVCSSRQ